MKNYETEARERWGDTDAYREYKEKTKSYIQQKYDAVNLKMKAIFDEFYACKNSDASSDDAQALVAKLQAHLLPTTIPAPTRFSQVLVRCILLTSELRKISTNLERELPRL